MNSKYRITLEQAIANSNGTQYLLENEQDFHNGTNWQKLKNPKFPDISTNPNRPNEKPKLLETVGNLRYLLAAYDITVRYDEILKLRQINLPNNSTHDIQDENSLMIIKSLCSLNGLSKDLTDYLPVLFVENSFNPITDWFKSKQWDGICRKQQLFETLEVEPCYESYRDKVLDVWFRQCVAAADNGEIGRALNPKAMRKFELVLILQGKQGAKKTSWFCSLLPDSLSDYIKEGENLDPTDKDTVKRCISSWICELGEIDATFRRADIARLKSFLSSQIDEIRLPYDKTASKFRRKTSFCASVNGEQFLNDTTGSRRFMALQILNCNYSHRLDMQQIFSQYWYEYTQGAIWWTSNELDEQIKARNEKHNEVSAIAEMVAEFFNLNHVGIAGTELITPTQMLIDSGIREPKRSQVKELIEILQAKGFRYKRTNGITGFSIAKLIK